MSSFCASIDARWIIDPLVNLVGKAGVWLSALAAAADHLLVDGLVNLTANFMRWCGGVLTHLQDGKVQAYLVIAMMVLGIWVVLVGMPIVLTLV